MRFFEKMTTRDNSRPVPERITDCPLARHAKQPLSNRGAELPSCNQPQPIALDPNVASYRSHWSIAKTRRLTCPKTYHQLLQDGLKRKQQRGLNYEVIQHILDGPDWLLCGHESG
jgi:hypothetical protein